MLIHCEQYFNNGYRYEFYKLIYVIESEYETKIFQSKKSIIVTEVNKNENWFGEYRKIIK